MAWVISVVCVAIFFAVVWGYYSRHGTDISQRPHDGSDGSPGSEGKSHISTADGEVEETRIDTHGTR